MALIKPEQLRSGFFEITGSLFGTSSYANYALTASYALNGGSGSGGGGTPFRIATGSVSASVDVGSIIFLITNNNVPILTVSQRGVVIFATQSVNPTGNAPVGGIYFTSSSLFVGLD